MQWRKEVLPRRFSRIVWDCYLDNKSADKDDSTLQCLDCSENLALFSHNITNIKSLSSSLLFFTTDDYEEADKLKFKCIICHTAITISSSMNDISHLIRHLNKKHLGLATAVSSRYPRMASLLSHIELGMFAKTEKCKKDECQGKLESYYSVSSRPDQNSITHEENASENNEIWILQGDESDDSDEYSKVIGNQCTHTSEFLPLLLWVSRWHGMIELIDHVLALKSNC